MTAISTLWQGHLRWSHGGECSQNRFLHRGIGKVAQVTALGKNRQLLAGECASKPGQIFILQKKVVLVYDDADVRIGAKPLIILAHVCVLSGGYDALSQLTFAGFDSLQALSKTHCKPFDAGRDGLSLGEGAGILALEEFNHALARGAKILGEIVGYGAATDIHHLTQPNPDGSSALESMQMVCKAGDVSPGQVDYVNAHGTATIQNDAAETNAINRWAGESVKNIRVSSTKSGIGHLIGAAGAVEAVVCMMALGGQWLPPQKNHSTTDPLCKFKIVTEETSAVINYALSNSFGFGGSNATLLFRRFA